MSRANILIVIAIAVICFSSWAYINQPKDEPAWPSRIQGFCFSPYREGQSGVTKITPSEAEIESDLALLADKTHAIRTYTVEGVMGKVPALARKYGLNVTLGAWLDKDFEKNEVEIQTLIRVTRENYKNVVRVVVGNESLLRSDLTPKQLTDYLDRVRQAVNVPVSTAEVWDLWYSHKELRDHVDYVCIHLLPYWEGISLERAVESSIDHYNLIKNAFPEKEIVIGEVGWPSNGRTLHLAAASEANEATFLRRFLARASQEKYVYYVMEAFDQPWKQRTEGGAVEAYWGVYDVQRQPKFPFTSPIVKVPEWKALAGISVIVAIITFAFLLIDSKTLRARGRSFLASVAFGAATAAVWIIYSYSKQYLTVLSVAIGLLMILGMIGVVVVLLTEAHEWAEATWVGSWRRPFVTRKLRDDQLPMVSVHVPAYNEPPEMMIETLDALAKLDYPSFEVIVVDNNTKDPAVWQPVQAHCEKLGPRFRFFHVDPLSGFKAGALNYALAQTASNVSAIAVIDSDYMVTPDWLRDMAAQFENPKIAIVQAPQDYRDDGENLFKAMCYAEYQGFFYIGMLTRNERNAIIQHGTMTMVRKSVLVEVGGWSEWCITEDAELGLRIFEEGYEATYIPQSYGKGLMPDTFLDFKKQRARWAYGAVQILRRHVRALRGKDGSALTRGQRYHFVAGWLPWLADSINLVFTMAALAWSMGMCLFVHTVDPPLVILSFMPLTLFIFKMGKMIYLYRTRVGATVTQTIASAVAGLSLSHTISQAILSGFVTKDKPFFRTPKKAKAHALFQALQSVREEGMVMVGLWLAAYGVAHLRGTDTPDLMVWVIVMLVQSIPYAAAVFMSLVSGFARMPKKIITNMILPPSGVIESKEGVKVENEPIPREECV
jgi:exo-beta-1,3-glucanase (GH17 family)/cellulose synthase/poly-beta-1,6-N-acetylglucosamine synthase-like glycosyltransferase